MAKIKNIGLLDVGGDKRGNRRAGYGNSKYWYANRK